MNELVLNEENISTHIFMARGHKLMLDADLAQIYGVETKVLNQAVKRNPQRFPPDFMVQLTEVEWDNLRSQFVTSSWGGRRTLPFAFTEHGAVMLASVLNSGHAVQASLYVVRAFIKMREFLTAHIELSRKLQELEAKYDDQFAMVFAAIKQLITPPSEPRERIGFVLQ
jgi:hypothetical protein